MPNDLLVGRKAIANALGCSEKTVTRLRRANKLPGAFKLGKTSPLKIARVDLKRVKTGKGNKAGGHG